LTGIWLRELLHSISLALATTPMYYIVLAETAMTGNRLASVSESAAERLCELPGGAQMLLE
jgi:hypothetical protein